jgi:aminopeptidase
MPDPRYRKLAKLLVSHSCALKKGDKVLIEATEIPDSMLSVLAEEVLEVGALPVVERKGERLNRVLLDRGSEELVAERLRLQADLELYRMKQMDAYIGLRGSHNITELSDVSPERMKFQADILFKPVHVEQRVKHTRWCVLRWPTPAMSQQAGLSTEAFEDFYFKVCSADYHAMSEAVKPLKTLMDNTDKVRITAPDTELEFSIQGLSSIPCTGQYNVPDGECFTAPVRDSVNGQIQFNSSTIYRGTPFDDIKLTFEKGKVVDFSSSNDEALGKILDSDDGARFIGEFALGFHPFIEKPMRDILFDEKIRGSLHLALGQAYDEADNGNRSAVHWDLVLRQESGGEIYFDDVLIRKDGKFVLPELQGLNAESLAN